ncbi:MAG: molybdenum cofactor biosynthesis protein MoaE [Candidatus Omnitrophica bacterium]|nr:molybdenum cofactor biosynthesis protein MoaE [Candidatus Omnitrophota bacterium]
MRYLTYKKISDKLIKETVKKNNDKNTGSLIIFKGLVRKDFIDKKVFVKEIFYESYKKMAEKKIEEIVEDAMKKFDVKEIIVKHRIGRVKPGEVAFLVIVLSSHRKEGFLAIQFVIDEIKSKVPIWKKEILSNNKYRWKEEKYV